MITIHGLDHIVLRTRDVAAMVAFYCDVLGCTIDNEQPDFGLTQLRAGSNLIDLVLIEGAIEMATRNVDHFCLRVKNFDYEAMQAYLAEHGIAVKRYGQRYSAQGLSYSFYIDDPEGNEVELCELL